jgi:hypothetical protein
MDLDDVLASCLEEWAQKPLLKKPIMDFLFGGLVVNIPLLPCHDGSLFCILRSYSTDKLARLVSNPNNVKVVSDLLASIFKTSSYPKQEMTIITPYKATSPGLSFAIGIIQLGTSWDLLLTIIGLISH